MTLIFTKNHYHANIILRRLIEDSIYLVLFDILSRFGKHSTNIFGGFFLNSKLRAKAMRLGFKITENDLKKRLEDLYCLNKMENEEKSEFITRFFEQANVSDFYMLLSKFICHECCKKFGKELDELKFNNAENFKHYIKKIKCEICNKKDNLSLIPCFLDI